MTSRPTSRGTVLFVGPILGDHPDRIASPAEAVGERLERDGFDIRLTSRRLHPLRRGVEMLRDIQRHAPALRTAVVLVYSGRSFRYADLASRLCRRLGIRVVFWLHGGGLPDQAREAPGRMRRVFERGEVHVTPSDFLRRELDGVLPGAAVIPNLVDSDLFAFRRRIDLTPTLLWMRSFVAHCRPKLAVRTLAELVRTRPAAKLTMAGPDQGELESTRDLARELGVTDRIRFVGFIGGERKRVELDGHDIYLHTNSVDNAPISLLEAGACGLPIVGCDVGGVGDLMAPDRACLLATSGEAVELARLVDRLVEDPASGNRLADAARRVAEAASWRRIRQPWLSALGLEPPRS